MADPALRAGLQTAKGAAFILVTSALLFELIRRGDLGLRTFGAEVRATVDSMLDAVLVVDKAHRIVEVNRAAMELFGVERKEDCSSRSSSGAGGSSSATRTAPRCRPSDTPPFARWRASG